MTILDRFAQALGYSKQNSAPVVVQKSGIEQAGRPQMRATYLKGQAIPPQKGTTERLNDFKGWVYACVKAIAEETSNIEFELYKRVNPEEVEKIDTHELLDVLHYINPLYTRNLLIEATAAYMELVGEAFWYLARTGAGGNGKIKEIWILRPDWVEIKDSKEKLIEGYKYGAPGQQKIFIDVKNIIHFKTFNATNPYRGYGGVEAGQVNIDTDQFASEYNRNFFYNDATPGGVLQTDNELTQQQRELLKEVWDESHQGMDNAWKIALLEGGVKWAAAGITQKEMAFIETRKMTRDETLAMFRVPKPIVAISDDVNRASAREARAVFIENVITHKMRSIVTWLNEFLVPQYGEDLILDFKDPVPNDRDLQLKEDESGLSKGWKTINEVRAERGYDEVEGGDVLYVPSGIQPLAKSAEEFQANKDEANAAAAAQNNPDDSSGDTQDDDELTPEEKAMLSKKRKAGRIIPVSMLNCKPSPMRHIDVKIWKARKVLERKSAVMTRLMLQNKNVDSKVAQLEHEHRDAAADVELTDEQKNNDVRWRKVVARQEVAEQNYYGQLQTQFTQQEQRVLSKLQQLSLGANIPESKLKADLVDVADVVVNENEVFAAPLNQVIEQLIQSEGIVQLMELVEDKVFYMNSNQVKQFIKRHGALFIKAVNEETRDAIRQELSAGITLGESIPQLSERVAKVYQDAKGYRATRIARTETIRATNFASQEAYRQSGVVTGKRWLTASDERVCPWCAPMDGKELELSETFAKKGDTITGTNEKGKEVSLNIGLSSVAYPPLHPNCRCTLIPIVSEEFRSHKTDATVVEGKTSN